MLLFSFFSTYIMSQRCSTVQDRHRFPLFIFLQPFMNLKDRIVFIRKSVRGRERERDGGREKESRGQMVLLLWLNTQPYVPVCSTCMKTCTASIHTGLDSRTHSWYIKVTPHQKHTLTHSSSHTTEHDYSWVFQLTVQTIQFSTMHLICPSGLERTPNHFNSLVKLAKHFLISLNAATAQCWETKLHLWRVSKMVSSSASL